LFDYEDFCESTDVSNQSLQFYLDGMNEENGEISGIMKRIRRGDYGEVAKHVIDTSTEEEGGLGWVINNVKGVKTDILKEIGDRHWYTTRFLQKIGADWLMVESVNVAKLKKRLKEGKIIGKGDNR